MSGRWPRRLTAAVLIVGALGTLFFGVRAYRTFVLLRSAHEAGAPAVANIRPWMTLGHVGTVYGVPTHLLLAELALPADTDSSTPIGRLAREGGASPLAFAQRVQRAVIAAAPQARLPPKKATASEAAGWGDAALGALLAYGYPALGLMLLLGALGAPLPTGLSTAVAGSLAAQGHLELLPAVAVAVPASVAGDLAGYGLGRVLGQEFLGRRGRWLGYTDARRRRVEALFARWGVLTVLLSRTLVSAISPAVNLVAGAARYRPGSFTVTTILGRVLWIGAYLAMGYGVVADLEGASGFLTYLTGLLISLALFAGAGAVGWRHRGRA